MDEEDGILLPIRMRETRLTVNHEALSNLLPVSVGLC